MPERTDITQIERYNDDSVRDMDFTKKSEDSFYDAVDLADFRDQDAETIYRLLTKGIKPISFGDYLKRYIYIKARMKGDFRSIDLKTYQETIAIAFAENGAPRSFTETSARLSALSKNWLTQDSVARATVFLLGFGLAMSASDVSEFLRKALKERGFNFKDPLEILYWYCFRNGYKYPKFLELKWRLDHIEKEKIRLAAENKTIALKNEAEAIRDDDSLMLFLASFVLPADGKTYSVTARRIFDRLYEQAKGIIAGYYNLDETEKPPQTRRVWGPEDITEGDVEKILCNGTPYDARGNLVRIADSTLGNYFSRRRLSRQHLFDITSGDSQVDRFDLITLNFFLFSQDEQFGDDHKNRFLSFTDNTNAMLEECEMGELYVANPYECFLMMCILSDCPLATYADVWEISYTEA